MREQRVVYTCNGILLSHMLQSGRTSETSCLARHTSAHTVRLCECEPSSTDESTKAVELRLPGGGERGKWKLLDGHSGVVEMFGTSWMEVVAAKRWECTRCH